MGNVLVAGGGFDNAIRIWDTQTGKLLRTLEGHRSSVRSLAFSPDGKTLVSGERAYQIFLWDLVKFEIQRAYRQPSSPGALAFLSDSIHFVSACGNDVYLWGRESLEPESFWHGGAKIHSLAVTAADEVVASTEQAVLKLYEPKTGTTIVQHKREKSATAAGGLMDNVVGAILPCPDGHILIGDRAGTWDWDRKADTFRLISRSLTRLKAVSPNGDFYFGVSPRDPYFFMRDRAPDGTLCIVELGWLAPAVVLSSDGQYLAVYGGGKYDAEGYWIPEGPQRILVYKWKDLETLWQRRKAENAAMDPAIRKDYSQVLPGDPPVVGWE